MDAKRVLLWGGCDEVSPNKMGVPVVRIKPLKFAGQILLLSSVPSLASRRWNQPEGRILRRIVLCFPGDVFAELDRPQRELPPHGAPEAHLLQTRTSTANRRREPASHRASPMTAMG